MAIWGASPAACFERFRAHIAKIVSATLRTREPILIQAAGAFSGTLQTPKPIPLTTRVGRLYLHLAQLLEAEEYKDGEGKYRLTTLKYWYRLQDSAADDADALIRWEYEREPNKYHCPQHVQQRATIGAPKGKTIELNKVHLPTGWVPIEDVIRFLIVDLRVKPPDHERWNAILTESTDTFFKRGKQTKLR